MQSAAELVLTQEPAPPRDGRRGLADSKERHKQRHGGAQVVARALVPARLLERRDARNVVCQEEAEDLRPRRGTNALEPRVRVGRDQHLAGEQREGDGDVREQSQQQDPEGRCRERKQPPAQLHLIYVCVCVCVCACIVVVCSKDSIAESGGGEMRGGVGAERGRRRKGVRSVYRDTTDKCGP